MESVRTFALVFGSVLLPIASMIYTWIATRDKDNAAHIDAVEKVLHEHVARLTSRQDQVEAAIKNLPRASELADLKADLRGLQAQQDALLRETKTTRVSIARIEDFLMRK
ncbi:hypothetical protein BRI6_1081 [plant metagenome]